MDCLKSIPKSSSLLCIFYAARLPRFLTWISPARFLLASTRILQFFARVVAYWIESAAVYPSSGLNGKTRCQDCPSDYYRHSANADALQI